MDRFDRVSVTAQMQDMLARENTALQSARIYQIGVQIYSNKLENLKKKRKQSTNFWRNKILERNLEEGKWLLAVKGSDNN